jgi:hypothetical protein
MNPAQIDRLLAGMPANAAERHARRVHGYATTARRIDGRISSLRIELERALRAVDESGSEESADIAIGLTRELDALERIQPRIDSWLRVAVGRFSDDPGLEPFGEGPA